MRRVICLPCPLVFSSVPATPGVLSDEKKVEVAAQRGSSITPFDRLLDFPSTQGVNLYPDL